jgi:diguanylate cyclase (GGDEF)-like protein
MSRLEHVMEWRDADKCVLASTLTLPFVALWILRLTLVGHYPSVGAYLNPEFLPTMLAFVWFQALGHLAIIGIALALPKIPVRRPWLLHLTNQFWYACFFLDMYAIGPYTSPFVMLILLAAVFGLLVFPLQPVLLALATFTGLLVGSTIAERAGIIPYAPLIASSPLHHGRPFTSWILSLGAIPLIASAVVLGLFAIVIGQWRDRETLLRDLVKTDYLTGVDNRRSFIERGEIEFARARRFEKPLTIVLFDVDHFKAVNDNYGHHTGDEILKVVARLLAEEVRRHDVIARYGGEEFALLLAETDEAQAGILGERCRRKIENARFALSGSAFSMTVSVGIASYPREDVRKIEQLIALADKALYQAKEAGRNKTVIAA